MEWFAAPEYPDNDPLLVRIALNDPPPPECIPFLSLDEIDPTPVMYELTSTHMYMMRLYGLDIMSNV